MLIAFVHAISTFLVNVVCCGSKFVVDVDRLQGHPHGHGQREDDPAPVSGLKPRPRQKQV